MSILDIFRQEYVQGRVVDKYRLNNGNLGLIVEDAAHNPYVDADVAESFQELISALGLPLIGVDETAQCDPSVLHKALLHSLIRPFG